MDDPSAHEAGRSAAKGAGHDGPPGQPGVIGIALAAVLAAALAQGSWEWFSTYIGVTLLALIFSFYRLPRWMPGLGSAYMRNLAAYSLVVGLCVAIALAPAMQRWAWLFPMPGSREGCPELGAYEEIRAEAELADLAGRDPAALARAQRVHSHEAVADCLTTTTTRWLPVYGVAAAVLVGLGAWSLARARARRETTAASRNPPRV
ncbi:hypothetical protein LRS74_01540 [Streptomyces sp. LX-29]|uniref:hypothetical protein n=1 Tax=Streptomyces sp. LX-29 TaxID=2900152 RepID=UPI00240E96F1|nr:hypothetical protein [Streptomyces sp. LX-29]WFB05851.1 hypothetical protein LRS74_01540 [Streptomyces sp. LX-29]